MSPAPEGVGRRNRYACGAQPRGHEPFSTETAPQELPMTTVP
jgi:hypothetical protein